MYKLKQWSLRLGDGKFIGCGNCYGNPRFFAGEYIFTSAVIRAEAGEESLKLYTLSGSCYVLEYAEISEGGLEETKEVMEARGIGIDLKKCMRLKEEKENATRKKLAGILKAGELYVVMAGGQGVREAYFKGGDGSVVPINIKVHTGMFQDSIIVADWREGLCDWRIFPSVFSVQPYHWSDNLEAVHMENAGENFVFRGSGGDILCKSGEVTVVKKEDFVGEGLLSPDTVNGKCLFSGGDSDLREI